ncbi:carotenoid ester lipase precursor [Heliocybe sulcata]|uniref:Carboxylic ester hydrolase n=1 Tax=Heliocybe sulcata TaxID=5364 RepID=A0A5C3MV37_9AGAM|nr:carotenoid ester lipase precursor [Heliocybe sulcata]
MVGRVLLACILAGGAVFAAPSPRAAGPTVTLDSGTFTGVASGSINKFLGIPYAQPPTGNLRFNLPQAIPPYNGSHSATTFGNECPQQAITLPLVNGLAGDAIDFIVNSIFRAVTGPIGEDCLHLNVWAPADATPSSKLPVIVWIFGGGFELGGTSLYDGGIIAQKSIDLGQPAIVVSMNYRVSAWGFLASSEVKAAGVGNLGLQDQREALRWIQKYIVPFGGDPSKVTIWGESAGAISVALQMLTNGGNTEGLFRGAFMESGSPIPVGDISHGQDYYDSIVATTGCSGASDTLECLRQVSEDSLQAAVDATPNIFSYQSLNLAWLPRVDGVFLADTPQNLVLEGSVANIPFVTGDCDDEGTLFSLANLNVTTESEVYTYVRQTYLPAATSSEIDELLSIYPADITSGSPFDTGILNALTPQFKRLAAMQGDLVFNAPRRFFLEHRSGSQKTWSFLSKRLKSLAGLGSAHATDILDIFGDQELTTYLVQFANNLDPNGDADLLEWPQYSTSSPQLLTLLDGLIPLTITQDTFRTEGFSQMTTLSLKYPL